MYGQKNLMTSQKDFHIVDEDFTVPFHQYREIIRQVIEFEMGRAPKPLYEGQIKQLYNYVVGPSSLGYDMSVPYYAKFTVESKSSGKKAYYVVWRDADPDCCCVVS